MKSSLGILLKSRRDIEFTIIDNAFVGIRDWNKAQKLADSLGVKKIYKLLDRFLGGAVR